MICQSCARIGFWFSLCAGWTFCAPAALAAVGTLADGAEVVTWGDNSFNQYNNQPTGTFSAIDAGTWHSVGLRSDGTVATWGFAGTGEYDNQPNGTFTAIAAGGGRHAVGLRTDGTVVTWGSTQIGQDDNQPAGTFAAIDAGGGHSVGLRTNGTVDTWGSNIKGQYNNTPTGILAIAAGGSHTVGLQSNGMVITWGSNLNGEYNNQPTGTFSAITAGGFHSVGIRSDGTVASWGPSFADDNQPTGTFTAIDAGNFHSVGIRSDGTVATWGENNGQYNNQPTGTFSAVSAGGLHSVGLRRDGTVVTWGDNSTGQYNNQPTGTFTAIATGLSHSVGLRARTDYDGDLLVSGTGVKANLNRSIDVAGNARIESPMYFYNNSTMNVAGRVTFVTGGFLDAAGAATIIAGGLEIETGLIINSGQRVLSTRGLTGPGFVSVTAGGELQLGLNSTSVSTGELYLEYDAPVTMTGAGYQSLGRLTSGYETIPQPLPNITTGGVLRMGGGQRLRFTATGGPPTPEYAYPTTNYNGGRIELLGGAGAGASTIEFAGSLTNAPSTGWITGHDAVMRFEGELANLGNVTFTGGNSDVFGDVSNQAAGKIIVSGGANATFYDDVVQNGTLRVSKLGSTTSTAVFFGSFTGNGGTTGGGDVFFEGDLRPGNSPAIVSFANNVGLGAGTTLVTEIGGLAAGTQYDRVAVTGSLDLGGTLDIDLINGFTPSAGNSFDILDFNPATLSGAFDAISLPSLTGGLAWDTSQLYTTGVLSVASVGVPGDYNNNGTVDAADFVLWRKGGPLANEVDAPGTVNAADHTEWRARFGNSGPGGGTAIPEPTTWATTFAALLLVTVMKRARLVTSGARIPRTAQAQ